MGLLAVIGMFTITVIMNNYKIIFSLTNGIYLNTNILCFAFYII